MGIVYILTNEAMPGYIKIGRTSDGNLKARIKQLDTTGIPLPFECFYAVKVDDAVTVEDKLHKGLTDCRTRDRREFFETSPEAAKSLLSVVEVMGGIDVTPEGPVVADDKDMEALKKAHDRRSRFNFGMLGIEVGEMLQFKKDRSIECEVASETQVSFRNEVMSLSKAAAIVLEEMGYSWGTVAGPAFWCYHGETLNDLRLQEEQLRECLGRFYVTTIHVNWDKITKEELKRLLKSMEIKEMNSDEGNQQPKKSYRQYMTAQEFKSARHSMGVSQSQLAKLMGVSTSRTIRMWENDEREVSGCAAVLLRWLAYGTHPSENK